MSDSTKQEKWACEYCTYKNYEASSKCTLCKASRPLYLISDIQNEEQDIYKMAATMGHNKESSSSGRISCSSASYETEGKWSCHACTYLNWPRSLKCTQCLTPRKKKSPVASGSPTLDNKQKIMSPVKINTREKISGGTLNFAPTNKESSSSSPKAAKDANNKSQFNDINKSITNYANNKWICKACTYANWPKANKCVICGTAKGRFSPEITSPQLSPNSASNQPNNRNVSPTGCGTAAGVISQGMQSPSGLSVQVEQQQSKSDVASAPSPPIKMSEDNKSLERRLKQIRKCMRENDWLWLNACVGVVDGEFHAVEGYIASGGDPSRALTQEEVTLLNRPSAFEVGYTLIHLAIRFKREDMLAILLSSTEAASKAIKHLPLHCSPDLASEIRREISSTLRQRKAGFPCQFLTECVTFSMPAGIHDLPDEAQRQLFDENLDQDVQKELEDEYLLNWSLELSNRLGSRLYALWNRTAGDCLLDSVLQATWGIFDSDNTMRRALAESLTEGAMMFYPRWKEYESMHAETLQFSLDETQWQHDWAVLLSLASQPGASLEQTHIFALAHILRRPIIVYGVKYVKSFRGETIGFARFQGVYLPLLWERGFCWKSPIALGYTRGHFSALVPMDMDTDDTIGAGANIESNDENQVVYLPLIDYEGKLLPVHFLTGSEIGREEVILREWLDCVVTKGGCLVALQKLGNNPPAVKQMLEEWLDHYRHIIHPRVSSGSQSALATQTFSSDGESDQE